MPGDTVPAQRAQGIHQSEVKVHKLHTASEVNRTFLSACERRATDAPPPGKCRKVYEKGGLTLPIRQTKALV